MNSRLLKRALAAILAYSALWAGTRAYGPFLLHWQLHREALVTWRHFRGKALDDPSHGRDRLGRNSLAYENGPHVEVHVLSCPTPFLLRMETGQFIGGLNGCGAIGWYLVTPWRVYLIDGCGTWVA